MFHWSWILAAALLLSLVLVACRRDAAHDSHGGAQGVLGSESILRLLQGSQSGIDADGVLVCRDAESFARVWAEHTRLQLPTPPAPDVDFEEWCVIGVFCGDRPSGGYAVNIESIERVGQGLRVIAREIGPEPESAQVTVMTMPFEFVAVPSFVGPVELDWVD